MKKSFRIGGQIVDFSVGEGTVDSVFGPSCNSQSTMELLRRFPSNHMDMVSLRQILSQASSGVQLSQLNDQEVMEQVALHVGLGRISMSRHPMHMLGGGIAQRNRSF